MKNPRSIKSFQLKENIQRLFIWIVLHNNIFDWNTIEYFFWCNHNTFIHWNFYFYAQVCYFDLQKTTSCPQKYLLNYLQIISSIQYVIMTLENLYRTVSWHDYVSVIGKINNKGNHVVFPWNDRKIGKLLLIMVLLRGIDCWHFYLIWCT